jgi:hypothetical protein
VSDAEFDVILREIVAQSACYAIVSEAYQINFKSLPFETHIVVV